MKLLLVLFFPIFSFAKIKVAVVDNFESGHGQRVVEIIETKSRNVEVVRFHVDFKDFDKYLKALLKIENESFDILNLSHGQREYNQIEASLLRKISEKGTKIIVAAGNDNLRLGIKNQVFPCQLRLDNLICVGASINNEKAKLSNYGKNVSLYISGNFYNENMTSYSAPNLVALLSYFPNWTDLNEQLLSLSKNSLFQNETISILEFNEVIRSIPYLLKTKQL